MRTHIYPRQSDIRAALAWVNQGDGVFNPSGPDRDHVVYGLRYLLERLDLPSRYELMRQEVLSASSYNRSGPDAGGAPSIELQTVIMASLRLNGYVWEPEPTHWAAVPLTGRQLHILRAVCTGATRGAIARELGVATRTVSETIARACEEHGVKSVQALVAVAYRRGWLPNDAEAAHLRRNLGDAVSPGYRREVTR